MPENPDTPADSAADLLRQLHVHRGVYTLGGDSAGVWDTNRHQHLLLPHADVGVLDTIALATIHSTDTRAVFLDPTHVLRWTHQLPGVECVTDPRETVSILTLLSEAPDDFGPAIVLIPDWNGLVRAARAAFAPSEAEWVGSWAAEYLSLPQPPFAHLVVRGAVTDDNDRSELGAGWLRL